jgi:hypothetical protein
MSRRVHSRVKRKTQQCGEDIKTMGKGDPSNVRRRIE